MSYGPRRRHSSLRQSFNDKFQALSPSSPGQHKPPQGDGWIAKNDLNHNKRVELHQRRSSSVSSHRVNKSVHQRPASSGSGSGRNSKRCDSLRVSILRDQALSRPQSPVGITGDPVPRQPSMSPVDFQQTFQDELNQFDTTIQSLRTDEWATPPTPRARARRVDGKQYGRQCAQDLKRWSNVQGFLYGQSTPSLRDTDEVQPCQAYAPGVIFSAPYHTSSSSDEMYVAADDPNLTATPFGTVCSKFRKMIVLKTFGEHCTCLPIYTHNGLGLEGKQFPGEFVSIRDVDDPRPQQPEGPHRELLSEKYRSFRGKGIAGKSVVKLTESYSHRYDSPATLEGILEPNSCSMPRLVELVKAVTG